MDETQALITESHGSNLDLAISAWLDAKYRHSNSKKTLDAYSTTLQQFRDGLRREGLDLDAEPTRIAILAQAFAGFNRTGKQVKPATYNLRLNILSSFFDFARKREIVARNPIEVVDRAKVTPYAGAMPLTQEQTSTRLAAIDRSTLAGKRDYALLGVLLEIGWRVSEVASLSWGSVQMQRGYAVLFCERAKGNEPIANTLSKATTSHLLTWLHAYYGAELGSLALDAPLWVSLAYGGHNGSSNGQRLGNQAIADICKRHLGVSKVHVTRHSAAVTWEAAGMPISEIQARLNHKSLGTTSIYLQQLKKAENRYADSIAALLGIE